MDGWMDGAYGEDGFHVVVGEIDVEDEGVVVAETYMGRGRSVTVLIYAVEISDFQEMIQVSHGGSMRYSQAMTLPPNLPTPNTRPQSLPSTLTTLQLSSPSRSFIRVLACPLTPSSPPSTCSGSSSGFVNPSHLLSILRLAVSTPMRNTPCAFADSVSRDEEAGASAVRPPRAVEVEVERASLVKRSEIALSWRRGGSMMWTSGWGHCGSCMASTAAAARTMMGISCVIVVSRS